MQSILSKLFSEEDPSDLLTVEFCRSASLRPVITISHASEGTTGTVDVDSGDLLAGNLRPSVHKFVCDWIVIRRGDIEAAWATWQQGKRPQEIPGAA